MTADCTRTFSPVRQFPVYRFALAGVACVFLFVLSACENSYTSRLESLDEASIQTLPDIPDPPPRKAVVTNQEASLTDSVMKQKRASASRAKAPSMGFEDRIKKHGLQATVRAKGSRLKRKKTDFAVQKADWAHPIKITFRNLKQNYEYYIVAEQFHPKGLPVAHGRAIQISGAIMPIDSVKKDGRLQRFWLANPKIVMAGCVFCNPPSLGDLVYVETDESPLEVDREELYRSVVVTELLGQFFIEATRTPDGIEYLYKLKLKKQLR